MKLSELETLMVQVEGMLLQKPIDPITESSVLDPVVIAAEKVLKEKRTYDRTTIETMIKLGQGDPLRMLKDQSGQPRLLARSDIETVFSAANIALILMRNIVSNNPAIFDGEEGKDFIKKLQEHLAPLSDEAIRFAEQWLHDLQSEMPTQSPSYVQDKAHQDDIKNLLKGFSYVSEDIITPSSQKGPLAIFFVGTEERLTMQKEASETQKNNASETEEAPRYIGTDEEVRVSLGLQTTLSGRPLPSFLSEELSPDQVAACLVGLQKCCVNHPKPSGIRLGTLLFSIGGNSKLITDLKRFIDDPNLIALHRGRFFNIVDKMVDKGLIDQKLLLALMDYRINTDPGLDTSVVSSFLDLAKRPALEARLDTLVNPNTRRSRVQQS